LIIRIEVQLPTPKEDIMATKLSAKGTQSAQRVISRYHRAIEKEDVDTAWGCLSRTYFRTHLTGGTDPAINVFFKSPKAIFRKEITQDASYSCAIEFTYSDIHETQAVVGTKETGSIKSPEGEGVSWKGVSNLWFLAKTKGEWKIASSVHGISE
jgi:hypothetical protein